MGNVRGVRAHGSSVLISALYCTSLGAGTVGRLNRRSICLVRGRVAVAVLYDTHPPLALMYFTVNVNVTQGYDRGITAVLIALHTLTGHFNHYTASCTLIVSTITPQRIEFPQEFQSYFRTTLRIMAHEIIQYLSVRSVRGGKVRHELHSVQTGRGGYCTLIAPVMVSTIIGYISQ